MNCPAVLVQRMFYSMNEGFGLYLREDAGCCSVGVEDVRRDVIIGNSP